MIPRQKSQTKSRQNTYLALLQRQPLTSIRTEAARRTAQKRIDELLPQTLDSGGQRYLDALSDLLIFYEREYHPISPLAPDRLLANLLEDRGMSQADLIRATGLAKATVSDLVSGKRAFTVAQMHLIAKVFSIPAHLFFPKE